jgi:hypothetical protein
MDDEIDRDLKGATRMQSATAIGLLDRLEIILEALAQMPGPLHTEADLDSALAADGHRPLTAAERRALAALGKEIAPSPVA